MALAHRAQRAQTSFGLERQRAGGCARHDDAGEEEPGVDGGEFAVPLAATRFHVHEVVEEPVRALDRVEERSQRDGCALARRVAGNPSTRRADGEGCEAEADGGDARLAASSRAVGARVQFDASILPSGGSGAAKFDAMSLAEYTGLLLNPGFAHGNVLDADFWTEHPTTEDAGREGWGSDDGDGYLMALPAYKSGTFGAFYQDVPGVKPGFRYTLTFSAAGEPPYNGSNVTARLIWLNNAMTPIASTTKDLDAYVNAWEWTRGLTVESISPEGATRLRVQFDTESPVNGAAAAKFDAFTLTRIAIPGTLIAVR